ncbi:unnamed protein product [Meloidogyne enterolobii]|uniref:Uncharacterized protein n=1 Tax=Meloidogyne enterolobii TaxID=390850 RepID=A0ACB0YGD8_MELEN
MEICTATNDVGSKKLSPPVFNAFQKSIGDGIELFHLLQRISMTISLNG